MIEQRSAANDKAKRMFANDVLERESYVDILR